MSALKRLAKEQSDLLKEADDNETLFSIDPSESDLFKWEGSIVGPDESPYEGGMFFLTMEIPNDYPQKPPKVKFTTRVYHPNIHSNGDICLDILKDDWKPSLTIGAVMKQLSSLLINPNPENPLEPTIAN